jgi:hypothetical protein
MKECCKKHIFFFLWRNMLRFCEFSSPSKDIEGVPNVVVRVMLYLLEQLEYMLVCCNENGII